MSVRRRSPRYPWGRNINIYYIPSHTSQLCVTSDIEIKNRAAAKSITKTSQSQLACQTSYTVLTMPGTTDTCLSHSTTLFKAWQLTALARGFSCSQGHRRLIESVGGDLPFRYHCFLVKHEMSFQNLPLSDICYKGRFEQLSGLPLCVSN